MKIKSVISIALSLFASTACHKDESKKSPAPVVETHFDYPSPIDYDNLAESSSDSQTSTFVESFKERFGIQVVTVTVKDFRGLEITLNPNYRIAASSSFGTAKSMFITVEDAGDPTINLNINAVTDPDTGKMKLSTVNDGSCPDLYPKHYLDQLNRGPFKPTNETIIKIRENYLKTVCPAVKARILEKLNQSFDDLSAT